MITTTLLIMDNNDGYRTPTVRDVQTLAYILKKAPNAFYFFRPFNRTLYDLLMSGY